MNINKSSHRRGRLIALEGLDRAGKSTQCGLLGENLLQAGLQVKQMRFPNRTTPIGQMINSYLKGDSTQEDHVIHLLFSANRWEAAAEIEEAINAGSHVIIDRYYYSGCVYSAAKNNPLLDLRWARLPEAGLPRPDLCVFLDISAENAAKRGTYGEERYEKEEMQRRVRQLFFEMKELTPEEFVIIDGGQTLDAVTQQIWEVVKSSIEKAADSKDELQRIKSWPS